MCTLLATAIGAAGTLVQGIAANSAAKAQARVSEANARIAENQAHDAVLRGGQEETKLRRDLSRQQGQQRAMLAAAGIDTDTGSSADIRTSSLREGEEDAAAIRMNAARERWGYQVQATNYRNEASAARAQGRNALFGSILGAGGQMVSAFAPAFSGGGNSGALTAKSSSSSTGAATPTDHGLKPWYEEAAYREWKKNKMR